MTPTDRATPAPVRREWVWCVVLAFALAAAVLWRPIALLGSHTLGPWDGLTHSTSLLRPDPPAGCANPLLMDPVRQMLPWAELGRRELAAGRAPLWNDLNGCGVPLLGNDQSALLSPFTLPFYVLPLKYATLLSALAKLACAFFFAFAFLRELGMSRTAGFFGALVYGCSGGQLLLLLYPHAAVTALLPGLLWLVERVFRAADDPARALRRAVPLALLVGVAGVAGHPEMLLVDALATLLYAAARALAAPSLRSALRSLALVATAGLLGAALAAPQLATFAEYLANSYVQTRGSRFGSLMELRDLARLVFPNVAGAPFEPGLRDLGAPGLNYEQATTYHVGALPLVLALGALTCGAWRTRFALWALPPAVVAIVVWDIGGVGASVGNVVSLGLVPSVLLHPYWIVGTTVLAAWFVDRAGASGARVRNALAVAALAALVWTAARRAADGLIDAGVADSAVDAATWHAAVAPHVARSSLALAVGALAFAVFACAPQRLARICAALVLFGAQLAATAGVMTDYTPTVPDALVLPETPQLQALRERVGGERVLFLGDDFVTADANALLGLELVTSYDALEVGPLMRLANSAFGEQGYATRTTCATVAGLELFGVRYVATPHDWLTIGTPLSRSRRDELPANPYLRRFQETATPFDDSRGCAVDAEGVSERFVAERAGLSRLVVHFAPQPGAPPAQVELSLTDAERSRVVASRAVVTNELRWLHAARQECVLAFEPLPDSAGREYVARVRALRPDGARARLWFSERGRRSATSPRGGAGRDESAQQRFVLDVGYGGEFADLGSAGRQRIFELRASKGRAWVVSGVAVCAPEADPCALLLGDDFDPYRTVLLEGAAAPRAADPELRCEVEELAGTPQRSRWRVAASADSHLVVSQTFYPGWRARLDGTEVPLLRANAAFCAVALPAGTHEVELSYEPRSFALGVLLAALGALGVLGLWLAARRVRAA